MIILLAWHTSPWLSYLPDTLHHEYSTWLTHVTMIILLDWHASPWLSSYFCDHSECLRTLCHFYSVLIVRKWSFYVVEELADTIYIVWRTALPIRSHITIYEQAHWWRLTQSQQTNTKFMFNVKTTTKRLFTGLINGGGNTKCWGTWDITSSNKGINLNRLFMSKTIPKSDLQTRSKHSKAQVNWTQKSTERLALTDV